MLAHPTALTEFRSPSLSERLFPVGDLVDWNLDGGETEVEAQRVLATCSWTACLARRWAEVAARRSGDDTVLSLRALDPGLSAPCAQDRKGVDVFCESLAQSFECAGA
jgi:hypothetical protein